nr:MAG TPA_asm: ABC transporter solute binding protein [Bacteriophage sp.]
MPFPLFPNLFLTPHHHYHQLSSVLAGLLSILPQLANCGSFAI